MTNVITIKKIKNKVKGGREGERDINKTTSDNITNITSTLFRSRTNHRDIYMSYSNKNSVLDNYCNLNMLLIFQTCINIRDSLNPAQISTNKQHYYN